MKKNFEDLNKNILHQEKFNTQVNKIISNLDLEDNNDVNDNKNESSKDQNSKNLENSKTENSQKDEKENKEMAIDTSISDLEITADDNDKNQEEIDLDNPTEAGKKTREKY